MTPFTKRYATESQAARAMANWLWLTSLTSSGVILPHATRTGAEVVMDRLPGRSPSNAEDLRLVAWALGVLHVAAHRRLGSHRLDAAFHDQQTGVSISDFVASRRTVLAETEAPIAEIVSRPAAIYKDANIRNVLLTAEGDVALVDFDDLTLAPVGYDLAKLVVSTAMTHGPLPRTVTNQLLDAYNDALSDARVACQPTHFDHYTSLHGVLTAPYLGRHGYRYPWSPQ